MLLSCPPFMALADTYRWVDKNGQVHYSDQIPPAEIDRAYSVINKEGVTVNRVEKAKTKEQLSEENRLKDQRIERENHDRILLNTYTNVSGLKETRDRYIATIEDLIKVSQHKLVSLNHELDKLNKIAANLERDGKTMPDNMHQDIDNLKNQIEQEHSFILAQRAQQQELRDKFATDIKRFQELKAEQQTAK